MVPASHVIRNPAMKRLSILVLSSVVFSSMANAAIPRKEPLVKYTGLWTNSPFTSKPPPPPPGETVNPLDDFTLTGIAPVPGGYRITIISKKNPELKKVIEPGTPGEFTVVSVNRNPDKYLGTTVVLSTGAIQGTVSFEEEMLTLKAPPAPQQPQQGNNNLPPGITPAQANPQPNGNPSQQDANTAQRQPRPRIVPPPTPNTGNTQAQPTNKDNQERSNRRNR